MTATTRRFDPTALENMLCLSFELGEGSWTDTTGFGSYITPTTRNVVTYDVPAGSGGSFSSFDVVAGDVNGDCGNRVACYGQMSFRFNVWSDEAAVGANPAVGNLSSTDVTTGLVINQLQFSSFIQGPFVVPTSLLEFDLSGFGISCPSCGCVVSLLADISASTDLFVVRQSTLGPNTPDDHYPNSATSPTPLPGPAGVRFAIDVDDPTCGAPVPSMSFGGAVAASALVLLSAVYAIRPRARSLGDGVPHP